MRMYAIIPVVFICYGIEHLLIHNQVKRLASYQLRSKLNLLAFANISAVARWLFLGIQQCVIPWSVALSHVHQHMHTIKGTILNVLIDAHCYLVQK